MAPANGTQMNAFGAVVFCLRVGVGWVGGRDASAFAAHVPLDYHIHGLHARTHAPCRPTHPHTHTPPRPPQIDSVGRIRGGARGNDERDQTLNQMLSEMDGFDNESQVRTRVPGLVFHTGMPPARSLAWQPGMAASAPWSPTPPARTRCVLRTSSSTH